MYKNYFKRIIGFTCTLIGFICISPIFLMLCILVRCKLGSPIFFHQIRISKGEKPFKMYKFRSMTNSRDTDGNLLPDEDRMTSFGTFLRNSSLDELPELLNVLKGEMSLVGPRPLYPLYLPYYKKEENLRHTVRAGITGLAQINGRALCKWDERFSMDCEYVRNLSLWNDIKILYRTFFKVAVQEDASIPSENEEEGLHLLRDVQQPDKIALVEAINKKYGTKQVPVFVTKRQNDMKPKLVILGTNEYQNPLILRAKELGYETHVYGVPSGQIGEKTADVYHPINILDYDVLWNDVKDLGAVGVASIASEVAMHPQNYLLRKMGIPCNSEWTEEVTTNKYLMRQAMKEAGIDSPNFMLINEDMSLDSIKDSIKEFSFPLIVKPIDLSSSRGVFKIENESNLKEAIEYAMSWSEGKKIILEEFVEGPEYSGDSIAYNGQYKLLAITEKHTTGAPHFVETGHKQPAPISDDMRKKVEEVLYKAFAALKIEYGAIHPEFRINPEGRVLFMEIATRMGGDCIGSDLVAISTGMDYMGMVINCGCGKAPDFTQIWETRFAEIKYIMNADDLTEYERIQKECPDIITRHSEMQPLSDKPVLKSADRAGYYITARKK